MRQDFLKKHPKSSLQLITWKFFCLVGCFLSISESHSAPFVFKPFVFKPTTNPTPFKAPIFKAPIFKSPLTPQPIASAFKPIKQDSPKKDASECNECLGKVLHIVDEGDSLTQAQCYECITSACPEASTMMGNEKYNQCKTSIKSLEQQNNPVNSWKVK